MKGLSLDSVLNADFSKFIPFIVDTLKEPSTNPDAFKLILALLGLSTVLLLTAVVGIFLAMGSDEREDEEEESSGEAGVEAESAEVPATAELPEVQAAVVEDEMSAATEVTVTRKVVEPSMLSRFSALLWFLAMVLVWVGGGIVSRQDTMCLTCHAKSVHSARVQKKSSDPHQRVLCVDCHESPNILASVTTAVPGRATHFLATAAKESSLTAGYGVPVRNASCRACHEAALRSVVRDVGRGVRMSHSQPLATNALCTDCHSLRPGTGAVTRYIGGMASCLRCHDGKQAKVECEECHTKDVGYAVATRGKSESSVHRNIVKCGGCHDEKTQCDTCHGMRMPHTDSFMAGGHAREAVLDIWFNQGRKCKLCHTDTRRPCKRCHEGVFPAHGVPTWAKDHPADPDNNGCDNCHGYNAWMVGRNFCANCHNAPIPRPSWETTK